MPGPRLWRAGFARVALAIAFSVVPQGGDAFQDHGPPSRSLAESIAEGFASIERGRFEDARTIFEHAIDQARADKDTLSEADAYRGLGRVQSAARDFTATSATYGRALALFESAGDHRGAGRVWNLLGADAYQQNQIAEARRCWERARTAFETAGLPGEEAAALRNLAFLTDQSLDDRLSLIADAVDRAHIGGARVTEGLALHVWGDLLFMQSRYAASKTKLDEALTILETAGSGRDLARLYTSLGRLYRIHGDPARALAFYREALARQRALGDRSGEVQSLNAVALALFAMDREREAERTYNEALALARSVESRAQVGFILQQLGIFHVEAGHYEQGASYLEDALTREPSPTDRISALNILSKAYLGLGRRRDASASADQAVEWSRMSSDVDARRRAHYGRAQVAVAEGRMQAAVEDARESLRLTERVRANLLPADPLKLGFAERLRQQFDFTVSLMMQAGLPEEALVVSEQGRSRAFLDLLATQEWTGKTRDRAELASLTAAFNTQTKPDARLSNSAQWERADPELRSFVAAEAPSIDELRHTAARLGSTVVSFWVAPSSTFVWVVSPDGRVRARVIRITASRLRALVQSTWAPPASSRVSAPPSTSRGDAAQPPADRLAVDGDANRAFRALYDILVLPLRAWLPGRGSLLTVVPHGPLLRLSFAALQDERQVYLVERYRLHYTPSLSVLQFTASKTVPAGATRLFLVASTSAPGSAGLDERLPPLPGARKEADAIARISRGSVVRVLTGTDARESIVRADAGNWTTLHFASHAIVSDDRPLSSYLALAAHGHDEADDGRLTTREIYGLDLRADLVVLSACRTAGGRITGDGIVGLTRAFMYAGSASIIASAWDLSDETAPRLFEAFYEARNRNVDKSAALRIAQLRMLRALRAGTVVVSTAAGRFTVPEHPSVWGGLQLWGEP